MPRIFLRCLLWKMFTEFFLIFGDGPQFAVVEQYTCNIILCIESSDSDCVADFSAVKKSIQRFEASIASIFLRLISFSVSSRLSNNWHFFHFSLPYRIISYSSVLASLITILRFARVDDVVSLYVILCLAVVALLISWPSG